MAAAELMRNRLRQLNRRLRRSSWIRHNSTSGSVHGIPEFLLPGRPKLYASVLMQQSSS